MVAVVRAEVASAAPPVMSPAHDALNAFFQFTDATGQGSVHYAGQKKRDASACIRRHHQAFARAPSNNSWLVIHHILQTSWHDVVASMQ